MTEPISLTGELAQHGVVQVPPLYSPATLASFGSVFDTLFSSQGGVPRSYVESDELFELGLLDEIFNAQMVALIRELIPEPQIYHCKVYETAANQTRPHINASLMNGWHRDADTISDYSPGSCTHLSIFVYLTDVGPGSGAFEVLPQMPSYRRVRGADSIEIHGPAGTTFIWNRSFFHRASPNASPIRRRILKLSIQRIGLPNDLLETPEFRRVRAKLEANTFVGQLFGLKPTSAPLAPTEADSPAPPAITPVANSSVHVTRSHLVASWALDHRHGVLRRLRGTSVS
jgi:hypothetical protein